MTWMTDAEVMELLPKHGKPALTPAFYRELVTCRLRFGASALVRKSGRGWVVDYRGHGQPCVWKTKAKAMEMAEAWVGEASKLARGEG